MLRGYLVSRTTHGEAVARTTVRGGAAGRGAATSSPLTDGATGSILTVGATGSPKEFLWVRTEVTERVVMILDDFPYRENTI